METNTYLFKPDKNFLKQGFLMKDDKENIIYEAKMTKFSLFGAFKFNFINHISNKEEEHKIGHTVTSSVSGLFEGLSINSSFKYDNVNVWDYLHDLGVRISTDFQNKKLGMSYKISLKGKEIATVKTSSMNGKSVITNKFCYDVTTSKEHLDLVFLVTFAFARTEQTFYV